MSELTPNLKLFKYNTETDAKQPFSINDCMNANWDKIDASLGSLEICDIGMALYIDESKGKRRYLNGQIVDRNANTEAFFTRLQEITTLYPSLLCTEEEWQATKTISAFGQVGKFVLNETAGTLRLPAVINIQGVFDLQNAGLTVGAGLPNIKGGTINGWVVGSDRPIGAINAHVVDTGVAGTSQTNTHQAGFSIDASRSNPIYGNNTTVQEEAIQYPYFIQIATGSETENNIINDIELNNPFSLFDSKYSDHELNNLSWLKSEGQWNAKAVYPTAYDKLLKVYNGTETVEGLSVKLSTEAYADYDFVINTSNETFRLPIKSKFASSKFIRGNGMAIGLTDGSKNAGIDSNSVSLGTSTNLYGVNTGTTSSSHGDLLGAVGLTLDSSKSGIELDDTNLYLYYYVGETVQNANLIDAGRIEEQLATKTDMLQASGAGMPSNKYINLTLGASGSTYTAPANGWFCIHTIKQTAGYTYLENTTTAFRVECRAPLNWQGCGCYIPARKNDVIRCDYDGVHSKLFWRFYYAQGEV